MWPQALIFVVLALAATLAYGRSRWIAGTHAIRARLDSARAPFEPTAWTNLPEPVRRYLREVLPEEPSRIAAVHLTHTGTFNMGESAPNWRSFTSNQFVVAHRPGFDWDARIALVPGVNAFVRDAYVDGAGILNVEAFGLIPIADIRDTPELAEGELQRFLAEAVWYPTCLLPGLDIQWDEIDSNSARASLRAGPTSVALTFHFNAAGLITSINTAARYRTVKGVAVPTPWECRVWNYQRHDGMLIPTEGEVSWLLPEGPLPYWRARITSIYYEFERKPS
jgi:hypothetical protein